MTEIYQHQTTTKHNKLKTAAFCRDVQYIDYFKTNWEVGNLSQGHVHINIWNKFTNYMYAHTL